MNYRVILTSVLIAAFVSACKLEITVPEGGKVKSESGAYTCKEGKTCNVNVNDLFFDETFEAIPKGGYEFSHWANSTEGGAVCGNNTEACHLYTSVLESNPLLVAVMESSKSFPLRPVFVEVCNLDYVNTTTEHFLNNGKTASSSSNVFDDPSSPINKLTIRNAGCAQGYTCDFPGEPTAVLVSACSVVNILDVFETSIADIDGGVVGAVHTFHDSNVSVNSGAVRDAEAYDSSEIEITGGKVNAISAFDAGEIRIEGGDLRILDGSKDFYAGYMEAQNLGHVIWRGGKTDKGIVGNNTKGNLILTFGSGTITIEGKGFTWSNAGGSIVDEPLDYGKLPKVLGWLSGTLANGDTFKDVFWEQRAGSQIVLSKPS